jgi:peptidoglycan/LPS O-acetylase OafA/YrhL
MHPAVQATEEARTRHRVWSLRRITSGSSWIPEIDGLRFVAIALVVLFHLEAQVASKSNVALHVQPWYAGLISLISRGDIGVRIFFVISGFILGRPFARHYLLHRERPSLHSYYLRRLTRLEPPYLLNIAICAVSIAIYGHVSLRALLPGALASSIYMHGLVAPQGMVVNPVAWTLEMEVQFYVLVPLLTLIFLVRPAWLRRTLLAAISIVIPELLVHFAFGRISADSRFWATIFWWLQYFLAGLLLSDVYVTEMPEWPSSWIWDVVCISTWAVLLFNDNHQFYPYEPLMIALAFIGAFRGVLLHRLFTIEWLALIGGMCYSLYLWHFFIIALVFKASRHVVLTHDLLGAVLVQAAIILPCVLGLCTLYFVLVERPCMDPAWPQKLRAALSGNSRRPEVM